MSSHPCLDIADHALHILLGHVRLAPHVGDVLSAVHVQKSTQILIFIPTDWETSMTFIPTAPP